VVSTGISTNSWDNNDKNGFILAVSGYHIHS